ncbi:hypothetical protein ACMA5I_10210 [Paracoccaceae bacterium GXU_MW_L88]
MKRTTLQNRSLHKLFDNTSKALVEEGVTMRTIVTKMEQHRIEPTPELVKAVWRAIQESMYGTKSTTELTTDQVNEVFEEYNKLMSELGVYVPFPSIDSLLDAYRDSLL